MSEWLWKSWASARRAVLALAVGAVCFGAVGCEESNDGDEIVPPPIAIRSTTPEPFADTSSASNLPLTLEIVLTRAAPPALITSRIFPAPISSGPFQPTSSTYRIWNWIDLELDPAAGGYHVLIDGVEFAQPFVLSFGVDSERSFEVGLGGELDTQSFATAGPDQAVVFALLFDTLFNPSQPSSWADARERGDIVSASSLFDDNVSVDEALPYRLSYLEENRRYYVVAICDTDGDLVYDPTRDWWGFSADDDGVFAGFQARPFGGGKDGGGEESVNITLRPPTAP